MKVRASVKRHREPVDDVVLPLHPTVGELSVAVGEQAARNLRGTSPRPSVDTEPTDTPA